MRSLHLLPLLFAVGLSVTPSRAQEPATPSDRGRPTLHTHLSSFGIPFRVNADMARIIEVQLYVSRDLGQSWQFHARQATNQPEFPFQSDGEGEYWFSLKTLDRNRQLLPAGDPQPELKIVVDQTRPQIDFRVETDQAGRVACRWDARDRHLDPSTFQILYRADSVPDPNHPDAQWHEVPIQLKGEAINERYSDQVAWWPEITGRQITVRLAIADLAGNRAWADRQIAAPEAAWRNRSESTARPAPQGQPTTPAESTDRTAGGQPAEPYGMVCENGVCQPASSPLASSDRTAERPVEGGGTPQALPAPTRLVGSRPEYVAPPRPPGLPAHSPATQRVAARPANPPASEGGRSIAWPSESRTLGANRFRAESTTTAPTAPEIPDFPARDRNLHVIQSPSRSGMDMAANRIANAEPNQQESSLPPVVTRGEQNISESTARTRTPEFLERQQQLREQPGPEVMAGSPGWNPPGSAPAQGPFRKTGSLGEIEPTPVETGASLPADPNSAQPVNSRRFQLDYGIESIDPSGVQRVDLWMTRDLGRTWINWGTDPDATSPFPVEVEEQGLYGFQIVIQSRDGLTGRPPQRGTSPDILIQVDTDAPRVEIIDVPYGRGEEAGHLIIEWAVNDPLLTLRPITLSWSDTPQGPWTTIEKGLRNTGRYAWKAGTDISRQVYLRIEAVDRAGNIGISTLSQPIDLSGLIPRARIRSVRPINN